MLNLKLKSEIKNNLLTYIIKWEFDEATDRETLYLFEELANSGRVFGLQGTHQRNLAHYFENGYFVAEATPELEKQIGEASFDPNVPLTTYIEKWKRDELTGEESCLLFKKLIETREIYPFAKDDSSFVRCVMNAVKRKFVRLVANEDFLTKAEEGQ